MADSEGQRSLLCCSPWGYKESDMTQWLNNNDRLTGLSVHSKIYCVSEIETSASLKKKEEEREGELKKSQS